jgi:sulfur carrier protein
VAGMNVTRRSWMESFPRSATGLPSPDSDLPIPSRVASFQPPTTHRPSLLPYPLLPHVLAAYDPPMQVQLSHPARTVEVKGPKKAKELLRELNLVVEAHLVIKGDDLVTEDEMLYDGDQIEIRPVISGG